MKRIPLLLNRITYTFAVAGLVGSLLIGATVSAQDNNPQTDRRGGDRGDRGNRGGDPGDRGGSTGRGVFGGLGLDEKQMNLYRQASEQNRDALTKFDEKLRVAQKELLQAAIAEKYDEAVVTTKAELVAKLQTEMTVLRAKALSTVAPTLKPEQREQLENSRIGAAMLTGGGMMGAGGPGGGDRGGFGGPGGDRGGRGRDGQPGAAGSENTGDRNGGARRAKTSGQ